MQEKQIQSDFNGALCEFLDVSSTPFHAVRTMSQQLEAAGFTRLSEDCRWDIHPGGRYYLTRNDSSMIAFVAGAKAPPIEGVRIVGAHTDSPCLMVKPAPDLARNGYYQLGVQVYGGALLNPWFDRDLSLAGRVSYTGDDGRLRIGLIDFRDPIAVIPSLAIHLDREANTSRSVNAQQDIVPLLGGLDASKPLALRELLGQRLEREDSGAHVREVLDYELCLYDTQPAALVGLEAEFIASARLDNLLSCFAGLQALLRTSGQHSALLVCNDHEEVGSVSAAGAQGPFLESALRRLAGGNGEDYAALVQRSLVISADNAHGIHPNFADKHDENHGPLLNAGPVIKVNASQRYASTAETSGFFRQLCAAEDCPVQTFVVRSDMACGSTIGPITAGATGIRTLDVGVPSFAMHSIRELVGAQDGWSLSCVLRRFFDHPGPLAAA